MARLDGGQLIARFLEEAGVRHIFTLSGGPLNPLYNACLDSRIQLIHTRHDSAAAFMAEGYSRASRGPGICALTLGTAVGMATPAVITAQLAATPLVVIAGAAARNTWEKRPFAHTDQLALMKPITKWARTVHSTARIPEYLSIALREATTGRPGPVFLDIPNDVMYGTVDESAVRFPEKYRTTARPSGDPALIREAVEMIARAARPMAIVGSGAWWSDAIAELRQFVDRTGIPTFTERMGRGALPVDHPLNFGMSAVQLSDVAIHALKRCDLLLMLGARFDYLVEFGEPSVLNPSAAVIQIDLEPEEIGYNRDVDLGIVGDLRSVLTQLLEELGTRAMPGDRGAWIEQLRNRRRQVEEAIQPLLQSDQTPIHPVRLIGEIRKFLDKDTVVVTSGGDIEQWGRWLLEPHCPGGLIRAGQTGSLGVDVPYSIAAKLARPEKKVMLLTGDGGFAYHLTEFDTASRYGVPFVAVVADDAVWAQIKNELDITYGPGRDQVVKMVRRRWDKVVEPLGAHAEHVTRPEEIAPAIKRAILSGQPACVHVETAPVASPETLWGFSPEHRAARIANA